jgi:hypothetical protein
MVVVLGTLVLAAVMAASGAASAAPGGPALVHGKKTGPVLIPGKQRTVGSLPLTKGRWSVIAKGTIVGTGGKSGAHLGVTCQLKLGSRKDVITAVPARQDGAGSRISILLTTAGQLKGSGTASLRCKGQVAGATKIRDIRITATKVGKLTTRSTVTPVGAAIGPAATTGSGKPVLISAKQPSARTVSGDGGYHPVTQLPLAAGRWWIVVKGVGDQASAGSGDYRCQVTTGGLADEIQFPIQPVGEPGDAQPFALVATHDFASSGMAVLECAGDNDFRVRNVVITAMRLGSLTTDFQPLVTSGSGNPRLTIGWNDGPIAVPVGSNLVEMLSQPLPKGKWLVVAKAGFKANDFTNSQLLQLRCELGFSGVKDVVELRFKEGQGRVGMVALQVPASSSGARSAVLRCRLPKAGATGELLYVKVSALKLGSILAWKL